MTASWQTLRSSVCGSALAVLLLAACAPTALRPAPGGAAEALHPGAPDTEQQDAPRALAAPSTHAALRREDVLWLERVSFGADSALLADYRRLGRERFLEQQLTAHAGVLPPTIAAEIDDLEISHDSAARLLRRLAARDRALRRLTDATRKRAARAALNAEGNRLAYETMRRDLLRALYSPNQLRELMVWFWLNHFSVYRFKGAERWVIADYEEHAIRPHALGHFRDLVLATLRSPAMLIDLDNRQNAVGHLNENYAREFMELHTLGVHGGYTQQDVEQLARVFTGAGVAFGPPPRLRPALRPLYLRSGAFQFNPARHDFHPVVLLGQRIAGGGFGEIERAVTLIVRRRACAEFISRELATYFMADDPPAPLVDRMARTFRRTDGDIAAVLRTLLTSSAFEASLGTKFKDPVRFVLSAVRLAYDGEPISNTRPLVHWLASLGESPYGRLSPDGYPLTASGWNSPGQMSRRFQIAQLIGSGRAPLFGPDSGAPAAPRTFPRLWGRLYYETLAPHLSASTRAVLAQAESQREWNTLLLSSPEFNFD